MVKMKIGDEDDRGLIDDGDDVATVMRSTTATGDVGGEETRVICRRERWRREEGGKLKQELGVFFVGKEIGNNEQFLF